MAHFHFFVLTTTLEYYCKGKVDSQKNKNMSSRAHCYLRTHRRLWGLTQTELAALLGCRSATHISRIERGKRAPRIEVALACEVLFNIPAPEMFPNLREQVEENVMRRAYLLYQKIAEDRTAVAWRKREFLEATLKRAVNKT